MPYVTHDTVVTVMNPSPWTNTLTVSYALMGSDPRTGTATTLTLQPGQTSNVQNLLPSGSGPDGSAYIRTNGSRPSVSATRPGLDIPVFPEEAVNNTGPQAAILQTGNEKALTVGGDNTAPSITIYDARLPSGGGYVASPPESYPVHIVAEGYVSDLFGIVMGPNSSAEMIPDVPTQSKAAMLLLYENSANLDQRIRKGQSFTVATR